MIWCLLVRVCIILVLDRLLRLLCRGVMWYGMCLLVLMVGAG